MSQAHFEVVHSGPYQFHARFIAANGEPVWVTESYRRRRTAVEAVGILSAAVLLGGLEIRGVEERTP